MQNRYVLADFELSYFFSKIKTRWNFWILFLKTIHQKGLFEQIKKKLNFCFCRRILEITDNLSQVLLHYFQL